jgi:hypothetical protein
MSSTCNAEGLLIGKIVSPKVTDTSTPINIVGVAPISVTKEQTGDTMTYTIKYSPYIAPTSSLSVSPTSAEIGETFNATYTSTWTKGTADLDGTALVTSPTTTVVNGLVSVNVGTIGSKTLTVTDKINTVTSTASISIRHRYFIGTKPKNEPNTSIVRNTGTVSSSMTSAYGAQRTYTIPSVASHIIWLVPQGTTAMGVIRDDGISEIETINSGTMSITNAYGVSVTYDIIMSKQFFAAGSTLNLKF